MIKKFILFLLFLSFTVYINGKFPYKFSFISKKHLSQSYYFYVCGTLQNSNNLFLSNITAILTFPSWNKTLTNISDSEGFFSFSDLLLDTSLILIGEIYFKDPDGIYSDKLLDITLYLGNAFTMDLGTIVLLTSTPQLINISLLGCLYSNNKLISNAFIFVQTEIIDTNEGSITPLVVLNSSGYPADLINISTIISNTNETAYVLTSNQTGCFQFFLSNASLRIEYQINLIVIKRYYNESRYSLTLVNTSAITFNMNMTSLSMNGNITGRFIDKYEEPILEIDLICQCIGGFEYMKNGLEIDENGYFYLNVTDIKMTRKKIICQMTIQSKGFSEKQMNNITLYRTKNYTKNLENVVLRHLSVNAYVYGNVYSKIGEVLNGILVSILVYNKIYSIKSSLGDNEIMSFNTTTNENGSFFLSFEAFLYSQVNCSLIVNGSDFVIYTKTFPLNELNNYLKNFGNITLKAAKVTGRVFGILNDEIFNSSFSGINVYLKANNFNRSYNYISGKNGTFVFRIKLIKGYNYTFYLNTEGDYIEPLTLLIFFNNSNSFRFNETINIKRKMAQMLIIGCVNANSSIINANITKKNVNETIILVNSSNEQGCFSIQEWVFDGFNYNVMITIISDGYYNKSMIISLNHRNNYTYDFGNITLDNFKINATVKGICVQNDTNQTIDNVHVYLILNSNSILNSTEIQTNNVVYRDNSEIDGKFVIIVDDLKEIQGISIIAFKKKGFRSTEISFELGNSTNIDLGKVYLFKKS